MSAEMDRAELFVTRLLANPALGDFSELQREEQIIQFLHVNAAQLAPTLSSPAYFPGMSWSRIFETLLQALYRTIDAALNPAVRAMLGSRITFTFVPFLRQQVAPFPKIYAAAYNFLVDLLRKPDARRGFTGAWAALSFNAIDGYLEEIFRRKSYIHFELTKVQRLRMGKDEIKDMVAATLLLKPAVYSLVSSGSQSQNERVAGTIQNQVAEKVVTALTQQLPLLPEQLIKSAVNASLSFTDYRFVEATSRLAAVFSARCRNYQPNQRVDRGADTPDKSWINTARRNYKFYGFDIKMLDELYMIAAENGW